MYDVKSRIYKEFDKTQKSAWCNYIRATVKKLFTGTEITKDVDEIFSKIIEDEKYYIELSTSRFSFIAEYIDERNFIIDTKNYINACIEYYNYKETQKPLIEAKKKFEKEKRKFLQEVKMSKEKPTKKQLYYYEKLCQKYDITKKDTKNLSKLDLKNEIKEILDENTRD